MKKKNYLNILIIFGLCFSMTGCGGTNKAEVKAPKASEEILNAEINSHKIQLGNSVVTLPVTLSDLLDLGAKVKTNVNPETEIVEPAYHKAVEMNIDNWTYTLYFFNNTKNTGESKRLLLKDCICDCSFVYLDNKTIEFNEDIIFPKGVKQGMSFADLKTAWGEPDIEDLDKFYYYKDHSVVSGTIDLETKIVTEIKFSYSYELLDSEGYVVSE